MVAREYRYAKAAVWALCMVQFMDVLGVTVVITTLPVMLSGLRAPQSFGSLVAASYAMFFGGLLMIGARLGDRYGHRRTILTSLAVTVAGAIVTATATSVVSLTAGRCLQGAAAGTSVPSALVLMTTITSDGAARQRAIAAWSAVGAAAGASGFVVGGIVTSLIGWRPIFWAYLPLTAVLGTMLAIFVPPDYADDGLRPLNVGGAVAFTAAVMAFVLGTSLITRATERVAGWVLLGGCLVLSLSFAVIDRRASSPLLPAALLTARRLRLGALGGFLNTATTSSALTLVTLYLQDTLRRSPLQAAASMLPFSLAVIAGASLSAALHRRLQPAFAISAGLTVIALATLALIPSATSPWAVPVCVAGAGLGIGLSSVAATDLGTSIDLGLRGAASGLINSCAQLGTAVGVAALILIAAVTTGVPARGTGPPTAAWAVCAAVAAAGAVRFAITIGRRQAPL